MTAVGGQAPRICYVLAVALGGTARHAAMLAVGCARAGLPVQVLGPPEVRPLLAADDAAAAPPSGPGAAGIGFAVVEIAGRPRPARDAAALLRLRTLLAATRPDVVHAHGLRAGAVTALALRPLPGRRRRAAARRRARPALVVTVHNAPPAGVPATAVYRLLERMVARRADAVLCVSADLEARMRGLGVPEVGRAVVPAGRIGRGPASCGPASCGPASCGPASCGPAGRGQAAPGESHARRPWPGGEPGGGRPLVLAVGRLAPQKGFGTLLEAAASWQDRRPRPRVLIAGTGPLAARLGEQAADLGVDAEFGGWSDDVPALLADADVVVLPSQWEGQPLVLQEALAAGRPIVATDVGGVRALTGDDAAVLVAPGDPASLAAAVLRVLDDPGLAASLTAAAVARAAALPTEDDAVAAALALYTGLAGRPAADR